MAYESCFVEASPRRELPPLVVWAGIDPSILAHPSGSKESEEVTQQAMTIGMLVSPLYFLILEGFLGMSLGKRWFGLRVLREDDTIPTWSQGLLRGLLKAGSMFVCIFPLAAIFGLRGTSWHDRAAQTKVVAFRKR